MHDFRMGAEGPRQRTGMQRCCVRPVVAMCECGKRSARERFAYCEVKPGRFSTTLLRVRYELIKALLHVWGAAETACTFNACSAPRLHVHTRS